MYEIVLFCILGLQILFLAILVYSMTGPDFDPQDIVESLKKSDAGFASGTSKQKKQVDTLLGEALLSQNPMVEWICNMKPELGDFLLKRPNMVPYASQLIAGIFGTAMEKIPIPEAMKPMLKEMMGQKAQDSSAREQKKPWE